MKIYAANFINFDGRREGRWKKKKSRTEERWRQCLNKLLGYAAKKAG